MNKKELAFHLDLANHHPDATPSDIKKLCSLVLKYGFHTAFMNSCYVSLARKYMGNKAKIGAVISFPLGQDSTASKISAVKYALRDSADELDVSMNVGLFKAKQYSSVLKEMKAIVRTARKIKKSAIVKFIIETGYLTPQEITKASKLVISSGADFVKTCSGYGPRGAELNDVLIIKKAIGNKAKIKVAGGISTTKQALAFLKAGAHRIGTSHAVDIVKGINSSIKHYGE
jgi:deoxyribose-phosphate aldolase